jgi:Flp pilus assembly protein TadD
VKPDPPAPEAQYTDIAWALSQGLSQGELVPMLERLAQSAPHGGVHYIYAKRLLAETLVREHPFRAARLASEVLEHQDDDRAHAVLGLSHMLLGNFRLAERAYRAALRLAPHSPWYAHNLGHLLDVALDRPLEAVRLLAQARKALPLEPEIASSYAHALLRAGDTTRARQELLAAVAADEVRADEILARWRADGTR